MRRHDARRRRGDGGGVARLPRRHRRRGRRPLGATGEARRRPTPRCCPSSPRCEPTAPRCSGARPPSAAAGRRALADRGLARGGAATRASTSRRCSTRSSTTKGRSPPRSPSWSSTGAGSSPSATHGALEHFDRAPTPVTADDALAQLVDGQVDAARGGRSARGRRPARPRRPGRGARVGRPGRPAPRHHAAPPPRHARRARLRGGLRRRPRVGRDPHALRRGPARHGALRGRPPAGGRARHALQLLVGHLEHHLGRRGPHRRAGRGLRPLPARPPLRADRDGQRRPRVRRGRHLGGLVLPPGHRPRLRPLRAALPARRHVGRRPPAPGRAGSTTAARWSRSTTRRTPAPTAPTGGVCAATRSSTSTRSAPSGPRATRARRSPSAPPSTWSSCAWARRPLEREDALVPWRAAMVQAFAGAR